MLGGIFLTFGLVWYAFYNRCNRTAAAIPCWFWSFVFTYIHRHTYFLLPLSNPLTPPPSITLSFLWLTVRVETGWKAVRKPLCPEVRESQRHTMPGSESLWWWPDHSVAPSYLARWTIVGKRRVQGKREGRRKRSEYIENRRKAYPTQKLCRIIAKYTFLLDSGAMP